MAEFMLLVLNELAQEPAMSKEQHTAFVKDCELYIEQLRKEGKLLSAQPLVREGRVISRADGNWREVPLQAGKAMQVGYYHLRATDLNDAVSIAKRNPEFQYKRTATIEVRPIKTQEENTGFKYPGGS